MSAYDGAGRLKQMGARMRAPSVGARTRSKQRKWRVLLSIGLLLPALAALIGKQRLKLKLKIENRNLSRSGSIGRLCVIPSTLMR